MRAYIKGGKIKNIKMNVFNKKMYFINTKSLIYNNNGLALLRLDFYVFYVDRNGVIRDHVKNVYGYWVNKFLGRN